MDYVTRQFINLVKKFRKESRQALIKFHDAIEKNTKATEKSADAQKEQAQTNALIASAIHTPRTHEHEYRAQEEAKNPMAWIKLAVQIGTLCVVAAYTSLTAYQLIQLKISAEAAKSAADTAREALVVGQRAYIVDSFIQKQEGEFLKIMVKWENKGETSTKFMTMHMSQSGLRHSPSPITLIFRTHGRMGKITEEST